MAEGSEGWLEAGRRAMAAEARAIDAAASRLGPDFERAVRLILDTGGKLVVCGIGKSGHVGSKLAATFSSCGIPSVFLHAAEAIHGDLGVYRPGDPTLVLSKSGSTAELVRLLPLFRKFSSPVIALVGNTTSVLAEKADVVLDASVESEADPLGLVPTSSAAVSMALGHALASALVHARGFTAEQFAAFHPGGQLGRNLLMTVGEVMHPLDRVASVGPDETIRAVVIEMTRHPLGAACILDTANALVGILTDGDVRRLLSNDGEILARPVRECMTASPVSARPGMTLGEAVSLMEDRQSQISVLPVVDDGGCSCVGLVRLHDVYQPHLS